VSVRYYCGVDLGQQADFTAIAVAERLEVGTGEYEPDRTVLQYQPQTGAIGPGTKERTLRHYHLRHLERLPLGTPYPQVVEHVVALLTRPPLAQHVRLAVDATGVGLPVVDMFLAEGPRRRADLARGRTFYPVLITGGDQTTHERGIWRVPKRTLVASVQVLLQSERLKIAATLPEAATLTRELLNFRVKITLAAHETYEAWREGIHDDLVLATALAVWLGEYEAVHRWGCVS
jgi:hypothetical protein